MVRLTRQMVAGLLSIFVLAAVAGSPGKAAPPALASVAVTRGLVYRVVAGRSLRLDAYLPASQKVSGVAIVIVHGGGWRSGSRRSFAPGEVSVAPTARLFAARGWATFSIDYRLAPAARFPAQVSDVESAVAWIRRHHSRYRIDPARIALLGASAGGNLAVLTALTASPGARVAAAVSWSGPMDLTSFYFQLARAGSRPFVVDYLGCAPASCATRYRNASPINRVTAKSPPILLANATNEIVPLSQAHEMASALTVHRVAYSLIVVPGSRHAADYEPAVIDRTLSFLARRLTPG